MRIKTYHSIFFILHSTGRPAYITSISPLTRLINNNIAYNHRRLQNTYFELIIGFTVFDSIIIESNTKNKLPNPLCLFVVVALRRRSFKCFAQLVSHRNITISESDMFYYIQRWNKSHVGWTTPSITLFSFIDEHQK